MEDNTRNEVFLTGIFKPKDLRYTPMGALVCNFFIATKADGRDNWIPCTAFGHPAEELKKMSEAHVLKDAVLECKGYAIFREWKGRKDGEDHRKLEIRIHKVKKV